MGFFGNDKNEKIVDEDEGHTNIFEEYSEVLLKIKKEIDLNKVILIECDSEIGGGFEQEALGVANIEILIGLTKDNASSQWKTIHIFFYKGLEETDDYIEIQPQIFVENNGVWYKYVFQSNEI